LGEKLCHEFINDVLHRIRRAVPPLVETINNRPSGRISKPLRDWTKTIHFPSGDIFGNELLIPLHDAPRIGSGFPPFPLLKFIR
jgi:hypothetical protein